MDVMTCMTIPEQEYQRCNVVLTADSFFQSVSIWRHSVQAKSDDIREEKKTKRCKGERGGEKENEEQGHGGFGKELWSKRNG